MARFSKYLAALWLFAHSISAIAVDIEDPESVKAAASRVAFGMMTYYSGNVSGQTPGLLPGPYYWWEAGAMFGALVNYWHYTGDETYNNVTSQALQFQVGPHNDYMPPNESASLGNDDQAFWGMAALQAAEYNFPNPRPDQPSWLSLAQAVFNEQIGRWDTQFCGGGIRWQIYQISGYDLKNSIANGCLFNIAARLARYTGNDLYANWAIKIWDWMNVIGLMDEYYNVYDNTEATNQNCTIIDRLQWSYNAGTMLMGAATMFNYTQGSELWFNRTQGLMTMISRDYFIDGGVMTDICEASDGCNVDEHSFKAYLARWMSASALMAPFTFNTSISLLKSSATAAAAQCNGAPSGEVCGLKWYLNGTWDGSNGVGQQMAALEVLTGTLIQMKVAQSNTDPNGVVGNPALAPVTNSTGGTSTSNPNAGYNATANEAGVYVFPPTNKDRAGAWTLTALIVVSCIMALFFLNTKSLEPRTDGVLDKGKDIAGAVDPEKRQVAGGNRLSKASNRGSVTPIKLGDSRVSVNHGGSSDIPPVPPIRQ